MENWTAKTITNTRDEFTKVAAILADSIPECIFNDSSEPFTILILGARASGKSYIVDVMLHAWSDDQLEDPYSIPPADKMSLERNSADAVEGVDTVKTINKQPIGVFFSSAKHFDEVSLQRDQNRVQSKYPEINNVVSFVSAMPALNSITSEAIRILITDSQKIGWPGKEWTIRIKDDRLKTPKVQKALERLQHG